MPTFDLNLSFCGLNTNICGNTSNQTLTPTINVLSIIPVRAPFVIYQGQLPLILTPFNHMT